MANERLVPLPGRAVRSFLISAHRREGRAAGAVSDRFDSAEGAPPIDDEVAAGLKADWISTRGEFNAAEQERTYFAALRTADSAKDYGPLVAFAAS